MLFPLLILFIALGGMAGALSAFVVFLLSSLVFEGALPVLLMVVVGLPIFILVMLAPWWCIGEPRQRRGSLPLGSLHNPT